MLALLGMSDVRGRGSTVPDTCPAIFESLIYGSQLNEEEITPCAFVTILSRFVAYSCAWNDMRVRWLWEAARMMIHDFRTALAVGIDELSSLVQG